MFFLNLFTIIMGAQVTSDVRTRYTDRVEINQPFPNITTGVYIHLIEMLNHLRAQPACSVTPINTLQTLPLSMIGQSLQTNLVIT